MMNVTKMLKVTHNYYDLNRHTVKHEKMNLNIHIVLNNLLYNREK